MTGLINIGKSGEDRLSSLTAFGPYELQGLVGRGGMGEVHRAFDREQGRVVALKLLPAVMAADEGFVERFKRESYAAARLNDPHVIPIHRYGEIDGRLYIDMRLVNGLDLAKLIARDGPLPAARAVPIIAQAAEALDAAHAENLIHRDVKPSNLLVTPQDFVYLVDFGVAHIIGVATAGKALTATGATVGTLDYMAPERFLGRTDVDARADVYSLACVLYECLTGQRPFPVDELPALMHAHISTPPPRATLLRPELPADLDEVVARGMAKDPAARYTTPGELAAAADRAIQNPAPGRAPTTMTTIRPPSAPPASPPTYIQPSGGAPPDWRPAPPPPSSTGRPRGIAGWLVAGISLVAVAVLVGVLLGRVDSGIAAPTNTNTSPGPTAASGTTTTELPLTAAPGGSGATPAAPTAQAATAGDLGLSIPISSPSCSSQFVTFVGSAVTPGAYASEVSGFLTNYPGSSYLLTELSCSSLRPRMPDGSLIYSVYLGPFATQAEACIVRNQAGGESYVKALDNISPDDQQLTC